MPTYAQHRGWIGASTFLLFSFTIAWAAWGLCMFLAANGASQDKITPVVILGSFGPFLAVGLAKIVEGGPAAAIIFYRRVLDWHMKWPVFIISFLSVPTLALITAAVFEHGRPELTLSLGDLPKEYLWLMLLGGSFGEEFGWSYLSDQIDLRLPHAPEIAVVGLIWALWHIPLFFLDIPGLSQKFVPFAAFLAMSLAMRALFSWAYHRSGRSILSNLLMHNGLNVGFSLALIVTPTSGSNQPRLWCLSVLAATLAALLWWLMPIDRTIYRQRPDLGS